MIIRNFYFIIIFLYYLISIF